MSLYVNINIILDRYISYLLVIEIIYADLLYHETILGVGGE